MRLWLLISLLFLHAELPNGKTKKVDQCFHLRGPTWQHGWFSRGNSCIGAQHDLFKTHMEKGKACHEDRAVQAVDLLQHILTRSVKNRILDLGAGCGWLQRWIQYVSTSWVYIPSDLITRDFPVIECDYNSGFFPWPANFSAVTALGVLEYMCDAHGFIRALRSYNTTVLLSYTPSELNPPENMIALANYMTSMQLEALLMTSGFRIVKKVQHKEWGGVERAASFYNTLYLLWPVASNITSGKHTSTYAIDVFEPSLENKLVKNDDRLLPTPYLRKLRSRGTNQRPNTTQY